MWDELIKAVECVDKDTFQMILDFPNFEDDGRVHNWRNYIPEYVKAAWSKLSLETRAVAYVMAYTRAEAEEWD